MERELAQRRQRRPNRQPLALQAEDGSAGSEHPGRRTQSVAELTDHIGDR